MRYLEHAEQSVSLVPNSERGFFISRYNLSHSAGRLLLLSEIPAKDIAAIAAGDSLALTKYLLETEQDCYEPTGRSRVALYDRSRAFPVVLHDTIYEVHYGGLPQLGKADLSH